LARPLSEKVRVSRLAARTFSAHRSDRFSIQSATCYVSEVLAKPLTKVNCQRSTLVSRRSVGRAEGPPSNLGLWAQLLVESIVLRSSGEMSHKLAGSRRVAFNPPAGGHSQPASLVTRTTGVKLAERCKPTSTGSWAGLRLPGQIVHKYSFNARGFLARRKNIRKTWAASKGRHGRVARPGKGVVN
jgi:hypothetical protein